MTGKESAQYAFKKLDLHVHTPCSVCYDDKSTSLERIVEAALSSGMDAIAITDHNTVAGIADFRKVAKNKNIVLFPGIELSAPEGHFIALFNVDAPIERLENLLKELGIPPERAGDATYLIDFPITSVFEKINEYEGLTIAAHIERWPSGFLETKVSRRTKMDIHSSKYLDALEITISKNREMWNKGKMKGYPKKYPCIQSSDAHAPDEIGRRFVRMHMEIINMVGLRTAFADPVNCIVFPADDN